MKRTKCASLKGIDYNQHFAEMSRRYPERILKIFADREVSVTWSQLETVSSRYGQMLLERGIGKGSRVALWMGNSPEYLFIFAALLRVGAVIVPLSVFDSCEDVCRVCRQTGVQMLILNSRNRNLVLDTKAAELFDLSYLDVGAADFELAETRLPADHSCFLPYDNEVIIACSSGTTGRKKLISKSISNYVGTNGISSFVRNFLNLLDRLHLLRLYQCCPWYHNTGTCLLMIGLSGVSFTEITMEYYQPVVIGSAINRYRAKLCLSTPTMLYRCCLCGSIEQGKLPPVIIFSGEAMSSEVRTVLEQRGGCRLIYNSYGSTESGGIAHMIYLSDRVPLYMRLIYQILYRRGIVPKYFRGYDLPDDASRLLGTIQKQADVLILSSHGEILPDGQIGSIFVKSSMQMRGYLGTVESAQPASSERSEASDRYRAEGYLDTGDLGYRCGQYLYLSGRKKNLIIRSGENIIPGEIEHIIRRHPMVEDVAVVGIPDIAYGENICACIQISKEGFGQSLEEIKQLAEQNLPRQMRPQFYLQFEDFPCNGSGKLDIHAIRNCARDILS